MREPVPSTNDSLPPHSDLAYQPGVTVGTIARAFTEAASPALVAGEIGRLTVINDFGNHGENVTRLVVTAVGDP